MYNTILHTLAQLDFLGERHAVGGCVRDALLGHVPHDVDVATPLPPDEVMRRAATAGVRAVPTGVGHGTVTLLLGTDKVEVTTYRQDVLTDGRRATVAYAETLEADLARRDFTINALAVSPTAEVIDPFGGRADLAARRLRAVGDPDARLAEDLLRVVRALRFAARFGLALEPGTAAALARAASRVAHHVSAERFTDELHKAFAHDGAGTFVRDLYAAGVLQAFIPDFAGMDALAQSPRHHPEGDVLAHTCLVVDQAPAPYRLHALLHDVGKGACAEPSADGPWFTFRRHEYVGAELIPGIAARLKLSQALAKSLEVTTRLHMRPLGLWNEGREASPKAVRRLQRDAGVHLPALEALCRADRTGRTGPTEEFLGTLFSPLPVEETLPALQGRHLIAAGWEPGTHFAPALARALEHQLETGCTDLAELLNVAGEETRLSERQPA